MKFRIKLLFLSTVLISSCTVMKRKYMSGLSIQQRGNPKYELVNATGKKLQAAKFIQIASHPLNPVASLDASNNFQPSTPENSFGIKKKGQAVDKPYKKSSFPPDTLKKPSGSDSLPMDENARKCGTYGIGALLTGIGSALLIVIAPAVETGTVSYLIVFTAFIILVLLCLALAIDAVNFGVKAFKDFHIEPSKYSGFDKALEGFIFGIISLLYIALITVVFILVSSIF